MRYRELLPLYQSLKEELRATLPLDQMAAAPDKLLDAYIDRLIIYVGIDTANRTLTAFATDARGEILDSLEGFAKIEDRKETIRVKLNPPYHSKYNHVLWNDYFSGSA